MSREGQRNRRQKIHLTVDEPTAERLRELADQWDMPIAAIVRMIIADGLPLLDGGDMLNPALTGRKIKHNDYD